MSESGYVNVDTREWPVVVITYDGSLPDERFREHLVDLSAYLRRAEPVVFISDIANSTLPTNHQQRMIGQMLQTEAEALKQHCRGWAQVARSPELREAAEAMQELMDTATGCFDTLDDARQWARKQLD